MDREGRHEPLIDKQTFDLCQQVAAKHRNYACRKRKHNFLLRGIVYCNSCGMRYTAEWHSINSKERNNRIAYYHCNKRTGCNQPYVEADVLESAVQELVGGYQYTPEFIELVTQRVKGVLQQGREELGEKREALNQRKAALEVRRNRLEDLLVDGVVDGGTYKRKHADLESGISKIDEALGGLEEDRKADTSIIEEVLAMTRNIKRTYKKASHDMKRRYLRFFFDKIYVEDGKIVGVKHSPLFEALEQERKVILSNVWLRGKDSNLQPSPYSLPGLSAGRGTISYP